ncbi:CDP-alcohol phosphatidyltransferase family protein [Sandaracinobacteroides hominis]|uniref:CDP-alcohol phosphatidyltransferase family protein n=1 Tax=Sandaracinobacteroides hominis TaxID=2780086 RepID=UPI002E2A3D02|nr:phosphatidylcholine/phosphatidylserine synthase [Sandaracinobacteroides hominis]
MSDRHAARSALPLRALIPNAITMLALCSGATGVRFAIAGEFEKAAAAIVIAALLDGIDGRVARMLRGTSRFGAELDSLSDVTAFGVAPALILYLWAFKPLADAGVEHWQEWTRLGWVVCLSLAVCCALRLARFNIAIDQEELPKKRLGFTTGVPAPAGAALALAPLFWSNAPGNSLDGDPMLKAGIVLMVTAITAFLMVSALPCWGFKAVKIPRSARLFVLAAVGLFAAALAQAPWMTLFVLALLYGLSVPFAVVRYNRLRKAEREMELASAMQPAEVPSQPG